MIVQRVWFPGAFDLSEIPPESPPAGAPYKYRWGRLKSATFDKYLAIENDTR